MSPDAERLAASHLPLARAIARRRCRHIPQVWHDDLYSAAIDGLVRAAEAFEPERGWKFNTYARWRIDGAVRDQMRLVYTGRRINGRLSKDRTGDVSIDVPYFRARVIHLTGCAEDPADVVGEALDKSVAVGLLGLLSDQDWRVASWYFVDGMTMADIGALLGVTESRVCQRVTAIKAALRRLAVRHELVA